MFVHSCQQMRLAEQAAIDAGVITTDGLMDAAVCSAAAELRRDAEYGQISRTLPRIVVYAGKGKNAGDALGIARELGCSAITVRCATSVSQLAAETRRQLELTMAVADVKFATQPLTSVPEEGALILDGLLGSGACGSLRPEYAKLAHEMNELRHATTHSLLLAVDIPTGLDADTGSVDAAAVRADATLAIGCVKPGMLADGSENYVGRLLCAPLPHVSLPPSCARVADAGLLSLLPRRAFSCYKNQAGRVRIIAGSVGFLGAAQMSSEAALRSGAGLVELFCLPEIYDLLAVRIAPEIMVRRVASFADVPSEGAQALLIGPGMGAPSVPNKAALSALLARAECPVVMDADALRLLAAGDLPWPRLPILTPHPGEMRALFPQAAALSRAETAAQFLLRHPCTLLLKGARSLISDGSTTLYNSTGGPFMANGGQGDVLAGTVAGLAAQGLSPFHAAALGAFLCGRAAGIARAKLGYPLCVCASDLLPCLTAATH